jgi:hypothetical protein
MKSLLLLPLAAVLLAAPAQAASRAAGSTAPRTKNPYIPLVQQRYDVLEIEGAMQALDKAAAWSGNGRAETIWLELMRGVLFFQMEEPTRARAAFQRALTLEPTATLPLRRPPTKLRELFDSVRAELGAPAVPTPEPRAEAPAPRPGPDPGTGTAAADAPRRAPAPAEGVAQAAPVRERVEVTGTAAQARPASGSPTGLLLGGGAALTAAGGALVLISRNVDRQLRSGTLNVATREELDARVAWGRTSQTLGWALLGTGAAGLLAGTVSALAPAPVRVSVVVTPSGVGSVISGTLP